MSTLEELVSQLEALDFEPHLDDSPWLIEALAHRQSLLTEIQNTDASSLASDVRASLKQRLKAVLDRDAELLEQLTALLADTRKALEQLVPGRAALRGYGETVAAPAQTVKRVG